MLVKNVRDVAVEVAATEFGFNADVDAGGVIEVSDELGARLCEQADNWREAVEQYPDTTQPPATVDDLLDVVLANDALDDNDAADTAKRSDS